MEVLREYLNSYLVHNYQSISRKGKVVEVGLYSIDTDDIKFRIIKFVNGAFKEIHTTEKREEADGLFNKLTK